MKYKKQIEEAFSKYGFIARGNQLQLINDIIVAFIDGKNTNVVLSAPTGTGKSIIAAIASEVLSELDRSYDSTKKSFILMHTNTLTKQYLNTFKSYDKDFISVMGAANYHCSLLEETAASCMFKEVNDEKRKAHCFGCEYLENRGKMNKIPHLITNYSYFFISTLYSQQLDNRLITVFDEAHIINDIFSSHMQIKVTSQIVEKMIRDVEKYPIENAHDILESLRQIIDMIESKIIDKNNYKSFLKILQNIYKKIKEEFEYQAVDCFKRDDYVRFKIMKSIARKYQNYLQKIDDFFAYNYEHVLDVQDVSVSISPIFFSDMFAQVKKSKYNLFMSATINKEFIIKTLNLPAKDTAYIKSPPVFDPETKSVVMINHTNYNYSSLRNRNVLAEMGEIIHEILQEHRHEKGIILTNSFAVNKAIADYLKGTNQRTRVIEHVQGIHLSNFLERHKASRGNSVLLSPSLFEGVDLPKKESEFQVFIKAPFPALGDKRVKYIFDHHSSIYELMTIFKIVQGFGRSTRSADDYSVTYALDANIGRLFNHKKNVWKDEFKVL